MADHDDPYFSIDSDGTPGDADSRAYFVMRALLSSRVELGLGSDGDINEEDVNIYLTHLLCDYTRPDYCMRVAPYLAAYDSSVFDRVRDSTSDRLKYTVYKANADHLLFLLGLFRNPTGSRPTALPEALRVDPRTHTGRASTYYDFASAYGRSLFGRRNGIAEVLEKLAARIEQYIELLGHLRVEHFNLVEKLSAGELFHLQRVAQPQDLENVRNEFLDAYAAWRQDPTPEARERLLQVVERLRVADEDFHFEWPET